MDIPSRVDWFAGCKGSSIFDNKDSLIKDYMMQFFMRTNQMFEYEGLPSTIPKEDYLLIKQSFGSATILKHEDKLYAFYGGLGGELNEYYHPTISVVTNPYLNIGRDFKIGEECIVIKNDLFYKGLWDINRKYAELLAECDISIRKCLMNIRIDNVVVSEDSTTDASIKDFFDAVKEGKFAHITTKKFMEDTLLQIHEVASKSSNTLKDLIEMRNYIDSDWFITFGLNANYNMKRETLTDAETNVDDKTLIPLIKQMYDCEVKGWDEVNKKYGTSVKVRLSDVWKKMYDEVMQEKSVNDDNQTQTLEKDETNPTTSEGGDGDDK